MKKRELFKVEGDKIVRLRRNCPKCGDGVFLAEHKNRVSCGNCGYTEFKSSSRETPDKPPVKVEEKPVEKQDVVKPVEEPVHKEEPSESSVEEPSEEKPFGLPKKETGESEKRSEESKEDKQKPE